ncbi:hypothetical protein E2C01_087125 [Portunus trituberculatus]|uniref:Uncharacterized protein n=1 Tax=Portunus trituberculatus TaxID=210409 RepID=A0A5B7JCH7_PORTR|nr:hypothetical protein [Portunus trituberculatus]
MMLQKGREGGREGKVVFSPQHLFFPVTRPLSVTVHHAHCTPYARLEKPTLGACVLCASVSPSSGGGIKGLTISPGSRLVNIPRIILSSTSTLEIMPVN